MSVPMPNTAVRADPNAWLPCLELISAEIVVIQVLICVCAVRKFQVHREPGPSSPFLGSDTENLILAVHFWDQY